MYRAIRSTDRAKKFYSLPEPNKEDVQFDLVDLERVNIGEPFAVTVNIKNKSNKPRTIQAILSAGSVYYTGVKANLVKRASGDFVLQPNASKIRIIVDIVVMTYRFFFLTLTFLLNYLTTNSYGIIIVF